MSATVYVLCVLIGTVSASKIYNCRKAKKKQPQTNKQTRSRAKARGLHVSDYPASQGHAPASRMAFDTFFFPFRKARALVEAGISDQTVAAPPCSRFWPAQAHQKAEADPGYKLFRIICQCAWDSMENRGKVKFGEESQNGFIMLIRSPANL